MDLLSYKILLIPLLVMIVTQLIKFGVDISKKQFTFSALLNYGGMPSGHTALVVSTATVIGLATGLSSPVFLLAFVLAILVIRDALGFRMQISEHAKILNKLIKELPDEREFDYPYSPERLGHTIAQVLVGAILGFALTLLLYYALP